MNSKQQQQQQQTINNNNNSNSNNILSDDKYIFCGRGHVNARRPGNQKFAKIIQANVNHYANAETRSSKVVVVASVVNIFRESGMKFVSFDTSTRSYVELSSERAHTKVSHAIRFQIKQNEKDNNQNFALLPSAEQKRRAVKSTFSPADSIRRFVRGGSKTKTRTTPTTTSGKKKGMAADDGADFNAWWAKHKSACFETMLWSAPPPTPELDIEDILDVSKTIFELGTKIDETASRKTTATTICDEEDWDFVIQHLLEKEDVLATPPPINPFFNFELSTPEQIERGTRMPRETLSNSSSLALPAVSLPITAQHEAFTPLPFYSDTKLTYEDLQTLSVIFDVGQNGVVPPFSTEENVSSQRFYNDIHQMV